MSVKVLFRHATEADWEAIALFILDLYREDPSPNSVTQENIARTLRETIQHPEKVQLIAFELANAVIGYSLLVFYWSNELGGNVIFIDELFVALANRGQGIATQFFAWLEQAYGSQAVAFMLETTPDNDRARALYQKLGFHPYKNLHLIKRSV
ncbi:MAG: GNAT family N-acetyltransferase [Leptolyngbyaceae cyanobacterium bins.302]|nr:GNAT family N-acetyltransferase [Leptolyngbyaceae cyanobacterium bins.302]